MFDTPSFSTLEKAMAIAVKAIQSLPETPFSAAGFNVRFKSEDPSDELLKAIVAPVENTLSDAGFLIESRAVRHALKFRNGLLNVELASPSASLARIDLNFHKQDNAKDELLTWLSSPIDEIKTAVQKVLGEVAQMRYEEGQS